MNSKFEIKYLGDYINGEFLKFEEKNGTIIDISPGDNNDHIMDVPFYYDHIFQVILR